jgi:hypothetical protein
MTSSHEEKVTGSWSDPEQNAGLDRRNLQGYN